MTTHNPPFARSAVPLNLLAVGEHIQMPTGAQGEVVRTQEAVKGRRQPQPTGAEGRWRIRSARDENRPAAMACAPPLPITLFESGGPNRLSPSRADGVMLCKTR
jgi:hypothetical protein